MRKATELYMNKSGPPREIGGTKYCAQSKNVPCSVPQIKDIIESETSGGLEKCPTVWDYMCELQYLVYIYNFAPTMCPKPCQTWHYKLYEAGRSKMGPIPSVRTNYLLGISMNQTN